MYDTTIGCWLSSISCSQLLLRGKMIWYTLLWHDSASLFMWGNKFDEFRVSHILIGKNIQITRIYTKTVLINSILIYTFDNIIQRTTVKFSKQSIGNKIQSIKIEISIKWWSLLRRTVGRQFFGNMRAHQFARIIVHLAIVRQLIESIDPGEHLRKASVIHIQCVDKAQRRSGAREIGQRQTIVHQIIVVTEKYLQPLNGLDSLLNSQRWQFNRLGQRQRHHKPQKSRKQHTSIEMQSLIDLSTNEGIFRVERVIFTVFGDQIRVDGVAVGEYTITFNVHGHSVLWIDS